MRKSSIKMYFFYFKAFSHVMGYHDGTQNFTIRKYDILAFKWRVLSIFSIPGSKVIAKNKRTLVKCPRLYVSFHNCGSEFEISFSRKGGFAGSYRLFLSFQMG